MTTSKAIAIQRAINYLEAIKYPIPADILSHKEQLVPDDMKKMAAHYKDMKAAGYPSTRSTFWSAVYDNVYAYLESSSPVTAYRNNIAVALGKAYIEASETAWTDGGGTLPIDPDTLAWAKAEIDAQMAYIDSLFEALKRMRREGDFDGIQEAFSRADGYSSSLDSFYNYIKTAAFGGKMLTFTGSDGRESCRDCKRLKGQRKRASWWISHELVPPSRHFECKGYNCDHYLIDDKGNIFTV